MIRSVAEVLPLDRSTRTLDRGYDGLGTSHESCDPQELATDVAVHQEQTGEVVASRTLFHGPVELQSALPEENITMEYYDEELDLVGVGRETDDVAFVPEAEGHVQNTAMGSQEALFPGCPLTVTASSVLLTQFKMRHNLTQEAVSDLLQLLSLHWPVPNNCVSSVYLFNKQFTTLETPVKHHYFCSTCLQEVESDKVRVCPNPACAQDLTVPNATSSFIEVPIEQQLKCVLERKLTYNDVIACVS